MTLAELLSAARERLGRDLEPDEVAIASRLVGRSDAVEKLVSLVEERPPEVPDAKLERAGYVPTRQAYLRKGKVRHASGAARIPKKSDEPVYHENVEGQPNKRLAHEGRWRENCPICTPGGKS